MDGGSKQVWEEGDSAAFIDLGEVYTPRRAEIAGAFLDLIPAERDDAFTGVELGVGAGWLSEAILTRHPMARMVGLDGSAAMRETAAALLAPFGGRFEALPFRLEAPGWIETLPTPLRCVVSSLVVHHLDGDGKRRLFADLHARLEPGGALLLCDVVEPANAWGRRHMARSWNDEVERQSQELRGDRRAFDRFVADRWNFHEFPDPDDEVDKPSRLVDQLGWLRDAGFTGVDAFWARAGHALFGGYRA